LYNQLAFVCNEPDIFAVRVAERLVPEPATVIPVWRSLVHWNPKLQSQDLKELYRQDKIHYRIDNVGLVWATLHPDKDFVEGHFVFWDGRLRGREGLVAGMARVAMDLADVDRTEITIPNSERMILRFLQRAGFTVEPEVYGYCRTYILRSRKLCLI
jgi:hypothetical protein